MSIQMIGIDHGRAPIPVRERFAFTKKACGETYEKLKEQPQVAGCIILSTCNRTEVWFDSAEEGGLPLKQWLCEQKNLSVDEYEKYLVVRQGAEAVEHLLHMTSGLRSLIVGEDQVLSQVRDAWSMAREWEATDKVLDVLFRMAVTGAKQVKTHMQISTANTSAIEHAIRFLKEQDYSLSGKTCMVIGNGEMGKRTALALLAEGADVTVTVRQYRSGVVEIPEGCRRINYGERLSFLPQCDLVVSATSSPNMTLKFEDVSPVHPSRPQVYVDLAVPRDIDPKLAELPGVRLTHSDRHLFEVLPEKAGKGNALRRLCDYTGFPLEKTIAMGDFYNDMDMVREAGFGAAPRSACPELRSLADYVAADNEQDAVAEVIEYIIEHPSLL